MDSDELRVTRHLRFQARGRSLRTLCRMTKLIVLPRKRSQPLLEAHAGAYCDQRKRLAYHAGKLLFLVMATQNPIEMEDTITLPGSATGPFTSEDPGGRILRVLTLSRIVDVTT